MTRVIIAGFIGTPTRLMTMKRITLSAAYYARSARRISGTLSVISPSIMIGIV
jgi:hypothetical protein